MSSTGSFASWIFRKEARSECRIFLIRYAGRYLAPSLLRSQQAIGIFSRRQMARVPFERAKEARGLCAAVSTKRHEVADFEGFASHTPMWSPDGKQLFYIPGPNQLLKTSVAPELIGSRQR